MKTLLVLFATFAFVAILRWLFPSCNGIAFVAWGLPINWWLIAAIIFAGLVSRT